MKKIIAMMMVLIVAIGICGCGVSSGVVNHLTGDSGFKGDYEGGILEDAMDGPFEAVPEGGDPGCEEPDNNQQISAGLLTAGQWKDLKDLEFWKKLLNRNDWYNLMETRNLYSNKVVSVSVVDSEENPCFNVGVELLNKEGDVIYSAITDVYGSAYLLCDLNNSGEEAYAVRVNSNDILLEGKKEIIVSATEAGISVTELDLMFMIDTTGSMSDELEYLEKEVKDVIKRVANKNEALSINISVNFYRDESDEYVVLDNPFYTDINKIKEILKEQSADGGGDYPEAVHTAINNAVNEHQWRENSVKLCFMVLDAPPHSEKEIAGIDGMLKEYVMDAAKKGIRIIPVASSGVDVETEFLMRSYAVMTGGTYIFLTDDSGIGGSHLEPTVGDYEVKALNDLMVEVILSYCKLQ